MVALLNKGPVLRLSSQRFVVLQSSELQTDKSQSSIFEGSGSVWIFFSVVFFSLTLLSCPFPLLFAAFLELEIAI